MTKVEKAIIAKNNHAQIGSETIETNAALRELPPVSHVELAAALAFITAPSQMTLKQLLANRRAFVADAVYASSEPIPENKPCHE